MGLAPKLHLRSHEIRSLYLLSIIHVIHINQALPSEFPTGFKGHMQSCTRLLRRDKAKHSGVYLVYIEIS